MEKEEVVNKLIIEVFYLNEEMMKKQAEMQKLQKQRDEKLITIKQLNEQS
jgi:hypothetical protein